MSTVVAGAQTDILAVANTLLTVSLFGGEASAKTKLARIYIAAHLGTLELIGTTGAAGPITAESAGGLSRQYGSAAAAVTSGEWGSTTFGQKYVALCRTTPARGGLLL